jgi:hypothetical protein
MAQPGYEGFGVLGDLLMGGPGHRAEEKYPQYLKQSADGYSALDKAAIVRAQRLARDNLPAAIAADPAMAAHAGLAQSVLGMATGQPNLGSYTHGLKDLGDLELDRQIDDSLKAGDTKRAQQLSAVKVDKVLPELGAGGKVVFTPIGGEADLTPLGTADVASTNALGEQRRATGEAATAKADAYVEHERAPRPAKAPHPSKIATRAATMDDDIALLEHELGRKVTATERADYLQGKPIKGDPVYTHSTLGDGSHVDGGVTHPHDPMAGAFDPAKATNTPEGHRYARAMQDRADALRAIANGAPRAAVAARYRASGNAAIAGDL